VRRAVDASRERGQFILTGSAVPLGDLVRHTGAGRFARLTQRTMTWYEKLPQNHSSVSLRGLFDGWCPESNLADTPQLSTLIRNILMPGFPGLIGISEEDAIHSLRDYAADIARADVHRIASVRNDPRVITQLLRAISRNVSAEVSYSTLAQDVEQVAPGISAKTISTYTDILERLFVVERQEPWTPRLRSRARLRTASRIHLVDPSLAAALLGANAESLAKELSVLGQLFESAVVHDLRVFASAMGGEVRHYRDSNGKEIDAVLVMPDGRWAAVEVKLGDVQITRAISSLDTVIKQIDTTVVGDPAFRLVITGTGPVFTANDDTITCPLSALAP